MNGLRLGLLISLLLCACGVFTCLFADFTDTGESFFETYRRLDVFMAVVCVALVVMPLLALLKVARRYLERLTIALWGLPFGFFAGFVTLEYWGEIEPGSYLAAVLSTVGMACAFTLSLLPEPAAIAQPSAAVATPSPLPAAPEPRPAPPVLPPAGWYPDPSGEHSRRYWDGETGRRRRADASGRSARESVPDAGEAREVAVVGDNVGPVLDGERGEVGVGREIARRAGLSEQTS